MTMRQQHPGLCLDNPEQRRPLESATRVQQVFDEASSRALNNSDAPDDATAPATEQEALTALEAMATYLENIERSNNVLCKNTLTQSCLRLTEQLAAMLPEWRRCRLEMEGVKRQLEAEEQAKEAAQVELTKLMTKTKKSKQLSSDQSAETKNPARTSSAQMQKNGRRNLRRSAKRRRYTESSDEDTNSDLEEVAPAEVSGAEGLLDTVMNAATPSRPRGPICPICQKTVNRLTSFRCSPCRDFWARLKRKYQEGDPLMSTCIGPHAPNDLRCGHCRRQRYEEEFTRLFPTAELDIPRLITVTSEDTNLQECEHSAESLLCEEKPALADLVSLIEDP